MKNFLNKIKSTNAFTVIELIVVMAVIAVLVFLGALAYTGYTKQAKFTQLQYDARLISDACERYFVANGDYPRLSDTPYTADKINSFTQKVYNNKGEIVTLDSSGSYYDVDFSKLKKYVTIKEDYRNFVLQNPVGDVYLLDPNSNIQLPENTKLIPAAPIVSVDISHNPPMITVTYPNSIIPQETQYQLDNGTITTTVPNSTLTDGGHNIKVRYKYNNFYSAWVPKDFSCISGVKQIAEGTCDTFAIKSDGSLWAWGYNGFGELGDGTVTNKSIPVKIMDNVKSIATGNCYTTAIKTDGSLWAWGYNNYGQLGDGTTTQRLTPIKIMDNVQSVASGYNHTAAIKTDGSLWTWGRNDYSQLGDGTTTEKHTPIKIMDNVKLIAVGHSHSVALKTDGSLWTWAVITLAN